MWDGFMRSVAAEHGHWFFEEPREVTPARLVAYVPQRGEAGQSLVIGWPGVFQPFLMASFSAEMVAASLARSPWREPRLTITSYGVTRHEESWRLGESGLVSPDETAPTFLTSVSGQLPWQLSDVLSANLKRVSDRSCPMAVRLEITPAPDAVELPGFALWSSIGIETSEALRLPYGSSCVEADADLVVEQRAAMGEFIAQSSVLPIAPRRVADFVAEVGSNRT